MQTKTIDRTVRKILGNWRASFIAMRIILICIHCGETFSRHKHIHDCPYCGSALEQKETEETW